MQETAFQTMAEVLAAARARCEPSTQKRLAEVLGTWPTLLANVAAGQRKLTDEQVRKLAALIEADAGELWELQEVEHVRRKNPFRSGVATIGALLSAFLAAVLLAGGIGLSQSQHTQKSSKSAVDALHIVALVRRMTLWAVGVLKSHGLRPIDAGC